MVYGHRAASCDILSIRRAFGKLQTVLGKAKWLWQTISWHDNNISNYALYPYSGAKLILQVPFLHSLMGKPVKWQYIVTPNCYIFLLQKPEDIFYQIFSTLWKEGTIESNFKQSMMSLQDRTDPGTGTTEKEM